MWLDKTSEIVFILLIIITETLIKVHAMMSRYGKKGRRKLETSNKDQKQVLFFHQVDTRQIIASVQSPVWATAQEMWVNNMEIVSLRKR